MRIRRFLSAALVLLALTVPVFGLECENHIMPSVWTVGEESTCAVPGWAFRQCAVCGFEERKELPLAPHRPELAGEAEPGCETSGYTGDIRCAVCKAVLTAGEIIPPRGHEWYFSGAVEADCTHPGGRMYACSGCDAVRMEDETSPLGHEAVLVSVIPAECLTPGYTGDLRCLRCGEVLESGHTVAPLGHSMETLWTLDVMPTFLNSGEKSHHCIRCDLRCDVTPIPALPVDDACDGVIGCPSRKFSDVQFGQWFHIPVDYIVYLKVMEGYSDGLFHPEALLNRAQLCQILYNREGKPPVSGSSDFPDVPKETWYSDAVIWAARLGIVTGHSDGLFRPADPVTREQMLTILWRYLGKPLAGTSLDRFPDSGSISPYAVEAIRWAVACGIVRGDETGRINPGKSASRAEIAMVLFRFFLLNT